MDHQSPVQPGDRDFVERAVARFAGALEEVVAYYRRRGRSASSVLGAPETFAERVVAAHAPAASRWDELVGPFLQTDGVQARLGITRQAVAARAARRRLLRLVTTDGVHLYPTWQFTDSGLLSGIDDVLALFPEHAVDGWTLAGWLRTPDPDLGEPPLDVLRRGDIGRVLAVAATASATLAA